MKKAVIFHGTQGSPDGNWFRWLEHMFYERGLTVWAPHLPRADQPSLKEWVEYIHENRPFEIDDETIIVGHSSGAVLALMLAQGAQPPFANIVCVSAFHDNSLGWEANDRLFDIDFNWPAIKAHAGKMLFVHSDNDPYVPLDQAQWMADQCQAELVMIPGGKHFNTEADEAYQQFPALLDLMTERQLL